jgi:hypothetical protein
MMNDLLRKWQMLLISTLAVLMSGCGVNKNWVSISGKSITTSAFSISFNQTTLSLSEGGAAQLLVVLSQPQSTDVSVHLALSSIYNDQDSRFDSLPDPLVVKAGQLSQSFVLNTINLGDSGGPWTYYLTLSTSDTTVSLTNKQVVITLSSSGSTSAPANPTLSLSDATANAGYARSPSVTTTIASQNGIAKWCLSETQSTQPAFGSSQCVGGEGTSNGWFTSQPSTFTLSSSNGVKTVYIWIADSDGNVNPGTVSATITLDTVAPNTPSSLTLQSPASSPGTVATPTITVGGTSASDIVTLYSDSNCTTAESSAVVASGTTVNLTTDSLTEGSYTFYAESADAGMSHV